MPSDRNIVYVEDFATCTTPPCGTAANPWRGLGSEPTGGIEPAIDECFQTNGGAFNDGCIVVLPRGYVNIASTIRIGYGSGSGEPRFGLVLKGHGSGNVWSSQAGVYAGTALIWTGSEDPGDNVVMRIKGATRSLFQDFAVFGDLGGETPGSGTDVGIEVTALNTGGHISSTNSFRNLTVANIKGDPGIGIRVGFADSSRLAGDEVDLTHFQKILVDYVNTGIVQNGIQTAAVFWDHIDVMHFSEFGMDFESADIHVKGSTFLSPTELGSFADVRVQETDVNGAQWSPGHASFEDNVHETFSGVAYLFCGNGVAHCPSGQVGGARRAPTTFLNTRILWHQSEGNVIDFNQGGALNLIGCTFDIDQVDGMSGRIHVEIPQSVWPTAHNTTITSFGNYYGTRRHTTTGALIGDIKMEIEGHYASLVSNDDPTHVASTPANSSMASLHRDDGIIFEEGSLNWKKDGAAIAFTQYLDSSSNLTLFDSASSPVASWIATGELKLQKSTAKLSFQNTSLVASSPSTSATVTVPSSTGTVVLDTASQTLTHKDLTDGTNAFPSYLATLSDAQSLSNKTLTATTNVFPQTSAFGFSSTTASASQRWFGPNSGTSSTTNADAVSIPMPAMTARSLYCKVGTAPGSGKTWTFTALKGTGSGTTLLSCQISSSATTCNATGGVRWSAGDPLSVRATPTSSPASTTVFCSLGVAPEESDPS